MDRSEKRLGLGWVADEEDEEERNLGCFWWRGLRTFVGPILLSVVVVVVVESAAGAEATVAEASEEKVVGLPLGFNFVLLGIVATAVAASTIMVQEASNE